MKIIFLTFLFFLQFNGAYASYPISDDYLVKHNAVGKIKTGMTIKEVLASLGHGYTLKDQPRAEVGSIALYKGTEEMFEMFFTDHRHESKDYLRRKRLNREHPDYIWPIDCYIPLQKLLHKSGCVVEFFEIYNKKLATKEGVNVTMTVSEAEDIYGKARFYGPSEIESQEYAVFENGPPSFVVKLGSCPPKKPKGKCNISALLIGKKMLK